MTAVTVCPLDDAQADSYTLQNFGVSMKDFRYALDPMKDLSSLCTQCLWLSQSVGIYLSSLNSMTKFGGLRQEQLPHLSPNGKR